jgi:hypothetical protein
MSSGIGISIVLTVLWGLGYTWAWAWLDWWVWERPLIAFRVGSRSLDIDPHAIWRGATIFLETALLLVGLVLLAVLHNPALGLSLHHWDAWTPMFGITVFVLGLAPMVPGCLGLYRLLRASLQSDHWWRQEELERLHAIAASYAQARAVRTEERLRMISIIEHLADKNGVEKQQ